MLEGGGEVILAGGLVVEGTLVVEAGTQLHAEGPVVLEPTMQLEIVLLNPDALEDGRIDIITCTPFCFLLSALSLSVACVLRAVHPPLS